MERLRSRVVIDGLILPEGIRWSQGKIWFSDILDFKVWTYDPKTAHRQVVAQPTDRPSGLGFLPDGRLLIATMGERKLLRLDPDGLALVADLSAACKSMNDMVVDVQGRAYLDANASGMDSMDVGGGIILVEPNGDHRFVAEDIGTPNGLAITGDGKTLVASDVFDHKILAFDIAPDGGLSNRRVFADLGGDSPDGLCLDAEGAAWVGLPFQGRFRRLKEGGQVTHEIAYDDRWAVAPVLGGEDRRSLYLCTVQVTLEHMIKLMRDPKDARALCKGWIEVVDGAPSPGAGRP
jgi:sugar lactone lactonase YvrE